jgi:hypothetical protein
MPKQRRRHLQKRSSSMLRRGFAASLSETATNASRLPNLQWHPKKLQTQPVLPPSVYRFLIDEFPPQRANPRVGFCGRAASDVYADRCLLVPPADTISSDDAAKHDAFIRRHNKARARSPCRNAWDRNLGHNVFARNRDPHDAGEHCRFVRKPRGTDR